MESRLSIASIALRMITAVSVLLAMLALAGCASISEGVTRGLMGSDGEPQPRPRDVTGPRFEGLAARLRRHEMSGTAAVDPKANRQRVKVMMVHGIGTHPPGFSTRFQRNLSAALGLRILVQPIKDIGLRSEQFGDEPLGHLRVLRFTNEERTRELLLYELSWSEITAPKKATLDYDTSGEFEFKRAGLNHSLKVFLNDRIADPMVYFGEANEKILESVSTGMCWMLIGDFDDLPSKGAPVCDGFELTDPRELAEDELVFVTHSLGSRIVADAFQREATTVREFIEAHAKIDEDRDRLGKIVNAIQNKEFHLYMLANQLPLLELGRPRPKVVGEIDAYCLPEGQYYDERVMAELFIVAFSDPNDPLSYAIPPHFAENNIDSRLCPRIVNVSVNVIDTINLFGVGEIAPPIQAHDLYDNDPRVIGLIVGGIGTADTTATVADECTWLEIAEQQK